MVEKEFVYFRIGLAGKVIGIQSQFPYVREYCRDYVTGEPEDFRICIDMTDITYEREKSAREDTRAGIPVRQFSDEYLETLAVYRKITEKLIDSDILLYHGSAIAIDGAGYLFTAKSGTGKSTHTRLLREYLGNRTVMINDDKPLLTVSEDSVMIHGTPWMGKHGIGNPISVPLQAICVVTRAEENHIAKVNPYDIYPMLLQQVYRPPSEEAMKAILELLDRLMEKVSFYKLECNMSPEAPRVSCEKLLVTEEDC